MLLADTLTTSTELVVDQCVGNDNKIKVKWPLGSCGMSMMVKSAHLQVGYKARQSPTDFGYVI
jgi:hypothetical protein